MPIASPIPATDSASSPTALVARKRTPERLTANRVGTPARIRRTAPTARPPLPPEGRTTLVPSSTIARSKAALQPIRRSKAPRKATTKLSVERT
jgi:hypothetical protein